jgi:quercetin dioxygenase-like cupin family protein
LEIIMIVYRINSLQMHRPPETSFVGDVLIGGYFQRATPSRLSGAFVTFKPGSRTPWKVNPLGQTLVVISGRGLAQSEGGETIKIEAGDMIWCPPGKRHWEGATAQDAMAYIAIHEGTVEFKQRVTEDEYRKTPSRA